MHRVSVTVEEEINNLKNYIKIIDERFGKKIHFKLDIKEEVLKDNMIKLCLQPLVENSIFHGLSERSNDGTIIIKIVDVNGLLEITVSDNGQGIEPNVLKKLQKDINDNKQINNREENNGHTSVGLRNINRRIRLYYGDTYGVFIESQYLEGTSVKLLIPLQNGKEFIC